MIVNVTRGSIGDKPMYCAYSKTNRFIVYQGRYTVARWMGGRELQCSIMHPRYTRLREEIDAAIAAAENR